MLVQPAILSMKKSDVGNRPVKRQPNILYLDIETAPLEGTAWTAWQTDILRIKRPFYILCFAVKKNDEKVVTHALPDYKTWRKNHRDDTELMLELREYLNWADVVVAHNGDQFDIKKVKTRMLVNNIRPWSPFDTVDTKKWCAQFGFERKKLDFVARILEVGSKLPNTGLDLWEMCMEPGWGKEQKAAWALMRKYNAHDVDPLLVGVFKKLRPWIETQPRMNHITKNKDMCPSCGSLHTIKSGYRIKWKTKKGTLHQRHLCYDCGHYWIGDTVKNDA